MITKKAIRKIRLEELDKALDKMDFTRPEFLERNNFDLEGVVFNIGKLLLEHVRDSELS